MKKKIVAWRTGVFFLRLLGEERRMGGWFEARVARKGKNENLHLSTQYSVHEKIENDRILDHLMSVSRQFHLKSLTS